MKLITLVLGLLTLVCSPLFAGNSIFSYDGFPIQYFGKDIYSMGMGDAGASDIFRFNTGYTNPALHNVSNRTLFATGLMFGYTGYRSLDDAGSEARFRDDSLDLPYFSLSVPLKRHRVGFQFNSFASGVVKNERTFTSDEGLEITEKQAMDKYLFRADLIYSVNFGRYHFGASGNYFFGHDIRNFEQQAAGFGIFNTKEELARTFKNPTLTIGALKHFDRLSIGTHITMPRTLKGGEIRKSIHEQEPEIDYDYKLPAQLAGSITALPFPNFKVATDFHYETWGEIDAAVYEDSWKLSLGAAYEPNAETIDKAGAPKFPIRAGISYRKLPFKADADAIDESGVSLGVTLPLKRDVNRIDLGFQYLRRGNLAANKLQDNSFMLMIGFTGFDVITKAPDRTAPREIPVKEELEEW
ncbi:MAG: hypothetical protein Q8M98_07770 [Candidatus Cloacimonadaceae bacterium]|nr:hypothetical protein [Candidatus Cloacimonadaceae bacterium]MDP3114661.1 hypothetical protein [Candidatus Cloacimonadaceae bacterium]